MCNFNNVIFAKLIYCIILLAELLYIGTTFLIIVHPNQKVAHSSQFKPNKVKVQLNQVDYVLFTLYIY